MLRLLSGVLILGSSLASLSLAQQPAPTPMPPRLAIAQLPQPPVPSDALELVPGGAQPVQEATQRAALLSLLQQAKQLSNLRAQPYHLKTEFTVYSSTASGAIWQMENIAPGNGRYHWTAQGPGYSVTIQYRDRMLYSNLPTTAVPLRLAQIRHAIFNVDTAFGTHASMRTASATLDGVELNSALTARMSPPKTATTGRSWEEAEFCIDPQNGFAYDLFPGARLLHPLWLCEPAPFSR